MRALCSACGIPWPQPPPARCPSCGSPPSSGRPTYRTALPKSEAMSLTAQGLAGSGIPVAAHGADGLSGSVSVPVPVSPAAVVVLCLFCLLPGLVYWVVMSNKRVTETVFVRFAEVEGGTAVEWSGTGAAAVAAAVVIRGLQAAPA